MNKKLLIGLGILLLLGAGGYMVLQSKSQKPSTATTTSTTSPAAPDKKSLRDLMAMGESQKCTYTNPEVGSQGTMYIGKGDVRGNFVSNVNGVNVTSHMISDQQDVYFWTEGGQGYKASLSSMASVAGGTGVQKAVDMESLLDYSCVPWIIDASIFERPSDVTFTDFSQMMEASTKASTGNDGAASQCAACESLPDEAKGQCRKAFSCPQ